MKRMLALILTAVVLLSGCDLLPAELTDLIPGISEAPTGTSGSAGTAAPSAASRQPDRDTGNDFHDNAPSLAEVGAEEYLAYFQASGDFVAMPDFHDERNPYEELLAEEKAALGKNFEEYYIAQGTMVGYFEYLIEEELDAYNEDKDLEDSVYLYLLPLQSMELAIGSSFSEEDDWAMLQRGMVMAAEMFGGENAVVTRNAAHNYTITYTDSKGGEVVDHFRADLGGGMQMLCYTDGVLTEFFEFRELGNDTYVWQNDRERLVMTYRDKTVLTAYYSMLPDEADPYGEADLIFGSEVTFDPDWVAQREELHVDITFDGTTLDIYTSSSFFGSDTHTVEVHIGRLRERFRENGDFKIITMRGVGYKVVKC